MSLHLLDTDMLSLLQEGHAAVVARVATCAAEDIAITVISVEEQRSGWYRRLRRARRPEDLAKVYDRLTVAVRSLSRLSILSFSEAAIHQSKAALQAARLNVRKMDLCIAAIALEHQAIVVPRNVRDFERVPNLIVEDWSQQVSPTRFRLTCIDLLAELRGAAATATGGALSFVLAENQPDQATGVFFEGRFIRHRDSLNGTKNKV